MKKLFILFISLQVPFLLCGQVHQTGDIVLNANYGVPQISAAIVRPLVRAWAKSNYADEATVKLSNSGVWNGKLCYGVQENVDIGFAVSYWNMGIDVTRNYLDTDPRDNVRKGFTDTYRFDLSALALGVRGNYHFSPEKQKLDPYCGVALGVTKYTYNFAFNSDYPDKFVLPNEVWNWKRAGWLTYFSTTLGVRVYPVKYIGLNFELGWDRGAFLFGGVVFKLHSKPPKFLRD
ncbi:MAG: hypothetical protein KF900_12130 [Bacteroidetes bacterium]|nr:hypothetical protein [Bacteroidota bacterium]